MTTAAPSTTDDPASDGPATFAEELGAAAGAERLSAGRMARIVRLAGASARAAGTRAVSSGRWLAETAVDVAGHVPVRDLDTLRGHHDGLSGALLARPLIRNASVASGAVGASTGALAAASATTPLLWATLPAELAVETLLVVAIEMKLAGELHEAAGYPVTGDLRRNGPLLARAWAETRGVDPAEIARLAAPGQGAALAATASGVLGRPARDRLVQQVQRRLVRRTGRSAASLVPMMVGAVAGAELNRRATRRFGRAVAGTLHIPPP